MKRILYLAAFVAILTACHRSATTDWRADEQIMFDKLNKICTDTTLTDEEIEVQYVQTLKDTYEAHKMDTLGLKTFKLSLKYEEDAEVVIQRVKAAPEWIRQEEGVQRTVKAFENKASVAAGMPYKEIKGVDALTGEEARLSQYLNTEKPVIVDFWASWCSPCREEIKNHLLALYAEGKVQIVGIAVWEDTVADTQLAMKQLGITWPVIYTGGRDDSPSVEWGVLGIPTLFALDVDGTILGSGHSVKDLPK